MANQHHEGSATSLTSKNYIIPSMEKPSRELQLLNKKQISVHLKTCPTYQSWAHFLHNLFHGGCLMTHSHNVGQAAMQSQKSYDLEDEWTHDQTHYWIPTWQKTMSVFMLDLMKIIDKPLKTLGAVVELVFNIILANGGLVQTICHLLFSWRGLDLRSRENEDFASLLAIMDSRTSLLPEAARGLEDDHRFSFPSTDAGSREIADVMVMASKIAYENEAYVKRVVSTVWKMNFVGFYDCWNHRHKQADTQLFLFTDQPTSARAIVLAFRGTEPFNALDWSTDLDFYWYSLEGLGKVHVGFLEALGLGDRERMDTLSLLQNPVHHKEHSMCRILHELKSKMTAEIKNLCSQPRVRLPSVNSKRICGSKFCGLSEARVHEASKVLAYESMTGKIKQLLKENPEAKLYVTGHSLGGALAALYTTLLFYYNQTMVTDRLSAVYTFGQPRVGDDEFSRYMSSKIGEGKYFRVVYSNDVVPRVPFDNNVFKFKHAGLCYYYNACYEEQTLTEAPYANFFSIRFVRRLLSLRLVALYELIQSSFLWLFYGEEYKESLICVAFRALGLLVPGISAHGLTNYINAIRLGPSPLVAKVSISTHEQQHSG